jgi:hypothetical protein
MRWAASRNVAHAAEDHPAGDGTPDPIGDSERILDRVVHQVVRQFAVTGPACIR